MNPLFDSSFLNQVNALIPLAGFQPKILEDIENGNRKSQSVVEKYSYTLGLEERFHAPSDTQYNGIRDKTGLDQGTFSSKSSFSVQINNSCPLRGYYKKRFQGLPIETAQDICGAWVSIVGIKNMQQSAWLPKGFWREWARGLSEELRVNLLVDIFHNGCKKSLHAMVLFKIVQNIGSVRRSEQCQSALEEMFYFRGLERLHENGQISQNEILRIFKIQIPGADFDIACKCSTENEILEREISLPNQENIAGNDNGNVMQFGIDNKYKGAKDITFQGHSNALDQQNLLGVAKSLPKFARTQKQFIFQVRDNNHIRWCYERQFAQIEPQNRLQIILELVTYIGSLLLNTNAYNRVPRGVNNIDSGWKKPTRSPPLSQKSPFKLERKEEAQLFVHVLCDISYLTSVEQLRRVMEPVRQEIKCSTCLDVLDEIFHVRQLEEQYLSNRISGDTEVRFHIYNQRVVHSHSLDMNLDSQGEYEEAEVMHRRDIERLKKGAGARASIHTKNCR